jgi:hypothetical protein
MEVGHMRVEAVQPGRPSVESQRGELESARSWVTRDYAPEAERNPIYDRLFHPEALDWTTTTVLDVGAGPISYFDRIVPAGADVVAYDTLADEYNPLIPDKKIPIVASIPPRPFKLVAILNCLDHMDAPGELLAHVAPHLDPSGRVWVYCNVGQPYDPALHPQNFSSRDLIDLVGTFFDVERCGLIREGRLFPYAWWAICRPRTRGAIGRAVSHTLHQAVCAAQFARFHGVRAVIKGMKLIGLRRVLPKELQF